MLRRALQQLARPAIGASARHFATINGAYCARHSHAHREIPTKCSISYAGNQVRVGMALDLDGRIYRVTKSQHVKPGKGGAYAQVELKEIKTGNKTNRRFRAAESVQKAPLGPDQFFQFLYQNGDNLVLMHNSTFEQVQAGGGSLALVDAYYDNCLDRVAHSVCVCFVTPTLLDQDGGGGGPLLGASDGVPARGHDAHAADRGRRRVVGEHARARDAHGDGA